MLYSYNGILWINEKECVIFHTLDCQIDRYYIKGKNDSFTQSFKRGETNLWR